MKKTGFTLTELLLTLTVIGVVSAVVAPNLGNIMPDRNKYKILKAYSTLSTINKTLLDDPGIYWIPALQSACPSADLWNTTKDECTCEGLECSQKPLVEPFNTDDYVAEKKYPALVTAHLEGETSNSSPDTSTTKFKSVDGIEWNISPASSASSFEYVIEIYIDGNYDNKFKFNVDKHGNIFGGDSVTIGYLKSKF